ncbi:hypothetical protein C8Q75DRAFT_380631 [Abortiporus biennis]|nr:hypothetical protein C8Q75DRAFT_380631 [Abortiporus biennis]
MSSTIPVPAELWLQILQDDELQKADYVSLSRCCKEILPIAQAFLFAHFHITTYGGGNHLSPLNVQRQSYKNRFMQRIEYLASSGKGSLLRKIDISGPIDRPPTEEGDPFIPFMDEIFDPFAKLFSSFTQVESFSAELCNFGPLRFQYLRKLPRLNTISLNSCGISEMQIPSLEDPERMVNINYDPKEEEFSATNPYESESYSEPFKLKSITLIGPVPLYMPKFWRTVIDSESTTELKLHDVEYTSPMEALEAFNPKNHLRTLHCEVNFIFSTGFFELMKRFSSLLCLDAFNRDSNYYYYEHGERDYTGRLVDKEPEQELPPDMLPKLEYLALPNSVIPSFVPNHPNIHSIHYINPEGPNVALQYLERLESQICSPSQLKSLQVHLIVHNTEHGEYLADHYLPFVFQTFPSIENLTLVVDHGKVNKNCAERICAKLTSLDVTHSHPPISLVCYHYVEKYCYFDGSPTNPEPDYGYFSEKDIKSQGSNKLKVKHASIQYMISERPPLFPIRSS